MTKKKVLIVNEKEVCRRMYMDNFESSGYIVLEAEDREQAIELLSVWEESAEIDLIIFDIQIPEANEIEIVKLINRQFPKIPIILISEQIESTLFSPLKDNGGQIAFVSSYGKKMVPVVGNSFILCANSRDQQQ